MDQVEAHHCQRLSKVFSGSNKTQRDCHREDSHIGQGSLVADIQVVGDEPRRCSHTEGGHSADGVCRVQLELTLLVASV